MEQQALGLIEVVGLTPAIVGADSALKAANVKLLGIAKVGANIVTVAFTGDVGAIQASVEAGGEAASKLGTVRTTHVIARLQPAVAQLFLPNPFGKAKEKPKSGSKATSKGQPAGSKPAAQKVADIMNAIPVVNKVPEIIASHPVPVPNQLVAKAEAAEEEEVPPLSPLDNQLEEQAKTEMEQDKNQGTEQKARSRRKKSPKS